MAEEKIEVRIRYKDVEEAFSGSLEEVWLCVNRFFNEFLPSFGIAKKIMLRADLEELVKACEGLIGFSREEGVFLLVSRDRLTDNEILLLWLLAYYLGFRLGFAETDNLSRDLLQAKLGKDAKITSTRLGELVKCGFITKNVDDRYRITGFGLVQMQNEIIPRIRAKMGK